MTESLAWQLLVASPALLDPNFYRTVVYIAEHGEAGALGLVLNRPTDAPVEVFETPLRLCIGRELAGRKLGIRYSLMASNLRQPAKGRLRLMFE